MFCFVLINKNKQKILDFVKFQKYQNNETILLKPILSGPASEQECSLYNSVETTVV